MKKNLFQPNYYVSIYDQMMKFYGISLTQAWIMVKIFNLSSKGINATEFRTGYLADILQVSKRSVQKNIKILVQKRLIQQLIVEGNKSRLKPSKEVANQLYAWMTENETAKGLNNMAL